MVTTEEDHLKILYIFTGSFFLMLAYALWTQHQNAVSGWGVSMPVESFVDLVRTGEYRVPERHARDSAAARATLSGRPPLKKKAPTPRAATDRSAARDASDRDREERRRRKRKEKLLKEEAQYDIERPKPKPPKNPAPPPPGEPVIAGAPPFVSKADEMRSMSAMLRNGASPKPFSRADVATPAAGFAPQVPISDDSGSDDGAPRLASAPPPRGPPPPTTTKKPPPPAGPPPAAKPKPKPPPPAGPPPKQGGWGHSQIRDEIVSHIGRLPAARRPAFERRLRDAKDDVDSLADLNADVQDDVQDCVAVPVVARRR